jgi:hypothetical protein
MTNKFEFNNKNLIIPRHHHSNFMPSHGTISIYCLHNNIAEMFFGANVLSSGLDVPAKRTGYWKRVGVSNRPE